MNNQSSLVEIAARACQPVLSREEILSFTIDRLLASDEQLGKALEMLASSLASVACNEDVADVISDLMKVRQQHQSNIIQALREAIRL